MELKKNIAKITLMFGILFGSLLPTIHANKAENESKQKVEEKKDDSKSKDEKGKIESKEEKKKEEEKVEEKKDDNKNKDEEGKVESKEEKNNTYKRISKDVLKDLRSLTIKNEKDFYDALNNTKSSEVRELMKNFELHKIRKNFISFFLRKISNIQMPNTYNSDIMKMVLLVVFQIEINKILYCSPLYGRNRHDSRCKNCNLHNYQSYISLPFSKWKKSTIFEKLSSVNC